MAWAPPHPFSRQALGVGDVLAAPPCAWLVKYVQARWMRIFVGLVVVSMRLRTLYQAVSG